MSTYVVRLRYFPMDPLTEIKKEDLVNIGNKYEVKIDYEKKDNRRLWGNLLTEDVINKLIEDVTQEVITVSPDKEAPLKECIIALYKKYRCPRTVYSLFGSNEVGREIAKGLMDEYGGW